MRTTLSAAGCDAILTDGGWTRSSRGNLTRWVGPLRVTVFERHGEYRWCVSNGTDVGYSEEAFASEAEAAAAVMSALESEV